MDVDRPMYLWRHLTPEQRIAVLEERKRHPRPWHGPPHRAGTSGWYLLTAARYDRAAIGFGAEAVSVTELSELRDALASAFSSRGPVCLNVQILSVRSPAINS